MKKLWALLVLGCAAASAQVIGLNPTPMAVYYWNTTTNAWAQCTNSSSAQPFAFTPQAFALYGYNSGLHQWTPQTTCPGSGSGGGAVIEVNSTPISPASPANFANSATVSWSFTGGVIQASTASSGFPITLGSTPIAASSTTIALTGLSINGVTLNAAGSSSLFLNQAGGYTAPLGVSPGSNYALPAYPLSTSSTVGPSNIKTDVTGNNISVPGAGSFGSPGIPTQLSTTATTIGSLPAASTLPPVTVGGTTKYTYMYVKDATGASDCTVGGSSTIHWCYSNGTIWVASSSGGGGTTVNVNGSPVSSPNFNGTTPAAPSNSTNASFQVSGSNVTIYLPNASNGAPGLMEGDGTTITCVASTGVCTSNTGVSAKIKYISQIPGIHQNGNLMASTGTDDTSLIEAVCNTATPSNIVILWQDGVSQITGLQCPTSGNWAIIGNGAGISQVNITNSTLSGGTGTFTTTANSLVAGQYVQLEELTNCSTLNNQTVTVSATGLSSTQFEATGLSGSCSSGAENGKATTLTGTGFFLANGSIDSVIENWNSNSSPGNCYVNPTSALPASRGSNIILQNFAINGNRNGATGGCHGVALRDVNDVLEQNVIVYNTRIYANIYDNVGRLKIGQSTAYATNLSTANTDGYHIDGGSDRISISDIKCHTGDDCFALNAPEGYCGPITDVSVNGVSLDNSQDAFRMDADGTCANGLSPTVSSVDIGHMEGTVYKYLGYIGNGGGAGSPDPGVFDISIHDSKISDTSSSFGAAGIPVTDATMNVTFANDTWIGPNWGNGGFWSMATTTPPTTHSLHIKNMTAEYTAAGSAFGGLFWNNANSTATVPVGNVDVDGFQISHNGATGTTIPCLICNAASPTNQMTASYVYYNNIDPTSIGNRSDGTTEITNPSDSPTNITALNGIGWGQAPSMFATHAAVFPQWLTAQTGIVEGNYPVGTWGEFLPTGLAGGDSYASTWGIDDATGALTQSATPPSGSCSITGGWVFAQNGSVVYCHSGSWTAYGGSGITGSGTPGYIPKFTGSTAVGNSSIDDGVTTAGTVTTTEPITTTGLFVNIYNPGSGSGGNTGFNLFPNGADNWQVVAAGSGSTPNAVALYNPSAGYTPFAVYSHAGVSTVGTYAGGVMGWNSDTHYAGGTLDTGLSRDGPGVVDVGNGSAENTSGTIKAQSVIVDGGTSTVYICSGGTFNGLLATSSAACTGGTGTATHLSIN